MEQTAPIEHRRSLRPAAWLLLAALLAILLAGLLVARLSGAGAAQPQTPASPLEPLRLAAGSTLGQSFVSPHAGLDAIELALSDASGSGTLRLHLRAGPGAQDDLAVGEVPLAAIAAPGRYRIALPPQPDSRQRSYYLLLEIAGDGALRVGRAPGDSYLDGAAYRDGAPLDAQLTFGLAYDPLQKAAGAARALLDWARALGAGLLLFFLPGLALLSLLWPRGLALSIPERWCLASGLGIAGYPILLLWTDAFGVHLGPWYAWGPIAAAVAALAWRYRGWRPGRDAGWRAWRRSPTFAPDLTLLALAALLLATRFALAGAVRIPFWGDSYQHTVMAQLIADNGGLFRAWQPYAEMTTFTYHFGFHTAAALFGWLTGLPTPQAVVWTGQVLNGLAVLGLYPLAARLSGSRWAGVAAVALAGFVTALPNGYLNWGRYTQLAGQAILPACVLVVWAALDAARRDWRLLGLGWLLVAGLALTHYRVLAIAALAAPAYVLFTLRRERLRPLLLNAALLVAGALLLYLPWALRLYGGPLWQNLTNRLSTGATALPRSTVDSNGMGDLATYLPVWLWLLLPLLAGWGLWRRDRGVAVVALWSFLVLLAANPQWLGLPGAGALQNFTVLIAAYIPAALIVGCAVGWADPSTGGAGRPGNNVRANPAVIVVRSGVVFVAVALGVALWGAPRRLADLEPMRYALATSADERAAAWIAGNTPPDARFLVNGFFAYGNTATVGSDGGWWLPLLAGRQTTLPPLTYTSERGPRPDYRQWVNQLTAAVQQKGVDSPAVLRLLRERGVTYVYIGQRQGRVNDAGPQALAPETLLKSPHFRPVYHQDRVWVFEVLSS